MSEELKPCPFCGCKVWAVNIGGPWSICGDHLKGCALGQTAIWISSKSEWNIRPDPTDQYLDEEAERTKFKGWCYSLGYALRESLSGNGYSPGYGSELFSAWLARAAIAKPLQSKQDSAEQQDEPVAWRVPIAGMYEYFRSKEAALKERADYESDFSEEEIAGARADSDFDPEPLYRRPAAKAVKLPEVFMIVERSIWTESQVQSATKCVGLLKNVIGMTDRDLALAAMDAAQCNAPDITLEDLAKLNGIEP